MEKLDLKSTMIKRLLELVEKDGNYAEFFRDNKRFVGDHGRVMLLGKYGLKTTLPWLEKYGGSNVSFVSYENLSATELMYVLNWIGEEV